MTLSKTIAAAALTAMLFASTAHAGGLSEPVMEPQIVVEESTSSSSGWLVPLLVLGTVAVVVAAN